MKIKALSKTYGQDVILDGIDAELPDCGLIGLVGASGSGKTTLLDCIGLNIECAGSVEFRGVDLSKARGRAREKLRGTTFAYVRQDAALCVDLTVREHMALICRDAAATSEILDKLEIASHADNLVGTLSGGQRQAVAFAMAYLRGAPVLLADEPTANMDAEAALRVMEMLRLLARDRLVIVACHDEALTERFADVIIKLTSGMAETRVLRATDARIAAPAATRLPRIGLRQQILLWRRSGGAGVGRTVALTVCAVFALLLLFGCFCLSFTDRSVLIARNMRGAGQFTAFVGDDTDGAYRAFGQPPAAANAVVYADPQKVFGDGYADALSQGRWPAAADEVVVSDYYAEHFLGGRAEGTFAAVLQKPWRIVGVYRTDYRDLGILPPEALGTQNLGLMQAPYFTAYADERFYEAFDTALTRHGSFYRLTDLDETKLLAGRLPSAEREVLASVAWLAKQLRADEEAVRARPQAYFSVLPKQYGAQNYYLDNRFTVAGIYDEPSCDGLLTDGSIAAFAGTYAKTPEEIDFSKETAFDVYGHPYTDYDKALGYARYGTLAAGLVLLVVALALSAAIVLQKSQESADFSATLYGLGFTRLSSAGFIALFAAAAPLVALILALAIGVPILSVFSSVALTAVHFSMKIFTVNAAAFAAIAATALLLACWAVSWGVLGVRKVVRRQYDRN